MNNNDEVRFVQILRTRLKYLEASKPLDMGQDLKSLGLDSMASVDLLFDIEDAFSVTLPDEYLANDVFSTAASLWQTICELQK